MVPNPNYNLWVQQDKLVLSIVVSTLFEVVLAHVVRLKTSRDVWTTLEKMFALESKALIMQTRYQLATLKKGS